MEKDSQEVGYRIAVPQRSLGEISSHVSRQGFLKLAAGSTLSLYLAGCGGDSGGSKDLLLGNFGNYTAPANMRNFRDEEGIKVTLETYGSGTEVISRIKGGAEYDVVVGGATEIVPLTADGLLAKLDHDKLSNLGNIRDPITKLSVDPGNQYSTPKGLGCVGFWYRPAVVKEEPKTSLEMFELLPKYKDARVYFFGDGNATVRMALTALGKDIDSTDPADLKAAEDLLVGIRPYVDAFGFEGLALGSRGLIDIAFGLNGDAHQVNAALEKKGDAAKFLLTEGSTEMFVDSWLVPTQAANPDNSHKWLNFMLDPENAAREWQAWGFLAPITGAEQYVDASLANDPSINLSDEVLSRYQVSEPTPESLRANEKIYTTFKNA